MSDPITLAALGAVALSEGVKFLYGQAGEVLKRRRERKSEADADADAVELPQELFQESPSSLRMNHDRADELEPELRVLRQALTEYGQGVDEIDPRDGEVLALVDALRRALEAVFGQPIVFRGEERPPQDVALTGEAVVQEVRGYVAGLRVRTMRSGQATGRVRADTVEGQAVGLDAGDVG